MLRNNQLTNELRHNVRVYWASVVAATLVLIACTGLGSVAKPQVVVKIAGVTVPTAVGSYCWSSGGHSECADVASIDAAVQAARLSPIRVSAGSTGTISFDRPPKSMDLMFGSDGTHLQAIPVAGQSFRAPSTSGQWEFLLSGHWDEGDVSWSFLVSVGNG